MKMLCFKFQQIHTKKEEFEFLRGGPIHTFLSQLIIFGKHMEMCFKFHQNRTINEQFDF